MRTVTGRLTSKERVDTSRNGNPRWDITINDGTTYGTTYRTIVDGSVGYDVGNYRQGTMVVLTLDKRDRVQWMNRADDE